MELDKNQILDFLREKGQSDKVSQAEQELPDHVDTDQHADLLQQHGVDPSQLAQGGLGDAAKNIGGKLGL
jgi:hypothetical protein